MDGSSQKDTPLHSNKEDGEEEEADGASIDNNLSSEAKEAEGKEEEKAKGDKEEVTPVMRGPRVIKRTLLSWTTPRETLTQRVSSV